MVKIDTETLRIMRLFDHITKVSAQDCFASGGTFIFVVPEGSAGRAIGKGGAHVRHLEKQLKRKIKIVEFHPDATVFLRNLVSPVSVSDITRDGSTLIVVPGSSAARGQLIGRNATYLRSLEEQIKRIFPDVQEIKIERWQTKQMD